VYHLRLPEVIRSVLEVKSRLTSADSQRNSDEIVELFDKMVDSGSPQMTELEMLRLFTQRQASTPAPGPADTDITTQAFDIRRMKVLWMSSKKFAFLSRRTGKTLDWSVVGSILITDAGVQNQVQRQDEHRRGGRRAAIEVDDMVFHQSAKLSDFVNNCAISFVSLPESSSSCVLARLRISNYHSSSA
jgi:hypothetical protein